MTRDTWHIPRRYPGWSCIWGGWRVSTAPAPSRCSPLKLNWSTQRRNRKYLYTEMLFYICCTKIGFAHPEIVIRAGRRLRHRRTHRWWLCSSCSRFCQTEIPRLFSKTASQLLKFVESFPSLHKTHFTPLQKLEAMPIFAWKRSESTSFNPNDFCQVTKRLCEARFYIDYCSLKIQSLPWWHKLKRMRSISAN